MAAIILTSSAKHIETGNAANSTGSFMDCSRTGKGHASSRCTKDGEAPIGLERVNNGEVVVGYTWGIPGDRLEALASSALPGL
jgi:hypothetical protein